MYNYDASKKSTKFALLSLSSLIINSYLILAFEIERPAWVNTSV